VQEELTVETFEVREGQTFRAEFEPGAAAELELVEVTRLPATGIGRADPFSLVFRAPQGTQHEQRIYRLAHDELGSFELFLVPIQPDERGPLYQAVFA
jgi:hypothetical protein